jgi:chromatin segregation and condensation protein Rec8/ScpA/Scc1 (kleisin family)
MPASTADAEAPLAEGSEHPGERVASEVPATSATAMPAPGQGAAEERTPLLSLDGFTGPLERLLTLARAHQVDLTQLSLAALIDQLVAALRHAPPATPLGEKGDWVVMVAWLVQLRSVLLLPPEAPARQDATVAADLLRARLIELQATQALAAWLRQRPQLGATRLPAGAPKCLALPARP